MPNLFAMSFEGTLAPSFDLRCLHPGRKPPDGWGIGYYPGGEWGHLWTQVFASPG